MPHTRGGCHLLENVAPPAPAQLAHQREPAGHEVWSGRQLRCLSAPGVGCPTCRGLLGGRLGGLPGALCPGPSDTAPLGAGYRVKEACGELTGTLCVPCDPGTYTAHLNGLSECLQCRVCDPGRSSSRSRRPAAAGTHGAGTTVLRVCRPGVCTGTLPGTCASVHTCLSPGWGWGGSAVTAPCSPGRPKSRV